VVRITNELRWLCALLHPVWGMEILDRGYIYYKLKTDFGCCMAGKELKTKSGIIYRMVKCYNVTTFCGCR